VRDVRHPIALGVAAVLALAAPSPAETPIPDHPDALRFEPIQYEPPDPASHRVELSNGMVVFIDEDTTLPLVQISLSFPVGSWLEPPGKEGLSGFAGSQMRRGGTESMSADELDERLDFLAAGVSAGIGETSGSASLNCLSDNLDEALEVFVEMLRSPRYQQDRLDLAREQALQAMQKRNDDSADIEIREIRNLLYGEEFFVNRQATKASVESITREDLLAFHHAWVHPGNAVAAVTGAFDRDAMIRRLETAFGSWPRPTPEPPDVPDDTRTAAPGLYRIEKEVNQGRVSMALPTVRFDHPDVVALEIMNEILGGSGFTSRITRSVRSDEGLAYSAGSAIRFGVDYTGAFRALFQSKSRSVPYAASLVLREIERIREEPVSEEELETIKRSLIETFPSRFESKAQAMATFAGDEIIGRDPGYWARYRDRVRAVTAADVQRVAREHIDPARLVVLVVGDLSEIDAGDGEHDVTLAALAPGGRETTLALPDPITMKRPENP